MNESPETLAALQAVLDESARTAGPRQRESFAADGWRMTAEELVRFWGAGRMASVSTASATGRVHVAVLDVTLLGGVFHLPTYPDALRLRDHAANSRCAISAWDDSYRAVVVYGDATPVVSASVVDVQVRPTRIYAIMPPAGHHAYRLDAEGRRV